MTDNLNFGDFDVIGDVYRTFDMVGHKVRAQQAKWIDDGWYGQGYIEGRLLNWNSDGTVYVHVSSDQGNSYGKVVRCMGDGMEFVE